LTGRGVFGRFTGVPAASVAQSVEHLHGKEGVLGSIPSGGCFSHLGPLTRESVSYYIDILTARRQKKDVLGMAKSKGKNVELVALQCSECDRRNYTTYKNKRNVQEKLEFNKYCKFDRKHTLHKEAKIK
jgi:large subunit ribosomal protein L33